MKTYIHNRTVNDLAYETLKEEYPDMTLSIKINYSSKISQFNYIGFEDKKLGEFPEYRELVIERLIYVRENKKSLLGIRTFEDYLVNEIGLLKGYFYEQLQAYEVCAEFKKTKLFKEVDHKILVNIAREKDPERKKTLIENAKDLSREDFKKNKQTIKVSPADFLHIPGSNSPLFPVVDKRSPVIGVRIFSVYKIPFNLGHGLVKIQLFLCAEIVQILHEFHGGYIIYVPQ